MASMSTKRSKNTDDFLHKARLECGQCALCGTQVCTVINDPETKQRRTEPLTVDGVVHGGRCLYCYPANSAGIGAMAAAASAAAIASSSPSVRNGGDIAAAVAAAVTAALTPVIQGNNSNDADMTATPVAGSIQNAAENSQEESVVRPDVATSTPISPSRSVASSTNQHQLPTVAVANANANMADSNIGEPNTTSKRVAKRKLGNQDGDNENEDDGSPQHYNGTSLAPTKRVATPGYRRLTQENNNSTERGSEMATIQDDDGLDYIGVVETGTSSVGYGRFEHTYEDEDDDEDLRGNVSIYIGNFAGGKFDGKGKLKHARGTVYEGDFKKGAPHGKGKCVWPDGWFYEGDWRNDKRHGRGKLVEYNVRSKKEVENGEQYEGQWKNDKMHGNGKLNFKGGGHCKGEFEKGNLHGDAMYYFSDGSLYCGEFQDGLRSGYGNMSFADGSCYEGKWLDNERNEGTCFKEDGTVYKGTYKNDFEYNGVDTLPDGSERVYKNGRVRKKK
ncbi:MORN repeat protein [Seminavis robusta]|uniref:MORN repeat protein n=1 Tax=Seminavis robusta TaxID=568900 RepID=A0A9N8HHK6_9STRA|nr:MORN repeat protein [Seminavis robusta]|eukprot:Sro714_g191670.1 MORN repeat protein (503) ;mRNA; f:16521-18329